jgi:hypothetical protein
MPKSFAVWTAVLLTLALLWQIVAIDWRNRIERSRYRGVNGEVA